MSKRKLEDELEDDWSATEPKIKSGLKKNSLDSDEEDDGEEKTYDILAEDEIEGQEEGAGGFDGEVRITPFNMREELEEGHFDTEGNYHWKKEANVRDNWLENIDWVKIKGTDQDEAEKDSDSDNNSASSPFDHIAVYRQMLELMKPGESVAKALRRLGGNKTMSASERWRRKKEGHDDSNDGNKQQVTELTELANRLLNRTGNMDVYQESYEHISKLIRSADNRKGRKRTAADYEDALDMYADDFDEREKARIEQQAEKKSRQGEEEEEEEEEETNSNDVKWEFKWQESSSEIHGPHSTSQMQAWVDQGYFKTPVLVRKCGSDSQFYSSARVDFELYL